jgi:hypothetical protein
MESVDRDLEEALTGLGLCPSPVGLASARHNDLLEVPHEFSRSSGAPVLERRYSYGSPATPRVQIVRFQGIPA